MPQYSDKKKKEILENFFFLVLKFDNRELKEKTVGGVEHKYNN